MSKGKIIIDDGNEFLVAIQEICKRYATAGDTQIDYIDVLKIRRLWRAYEKVIGQETGDMFFSDILVELRRSSIFGKDES